MPHSSRYVGRGWGFAWMDGDEPAEERANVLPRGLSRDELVAQLVEAAAELVRKQIYENPHSECAHAIGSALYCSECERYGVVGLPIEHAETCVAGRVSNLILELRRRERTSSLPRRHAFINCEGKLCGEFNCISCFLDFKPELNLESQRRARGIIHSYLRRSAEGREAHIEYQQRDAPSVSMTHEEAARRSFTAVEQR